MSLNVKDAAAATVTLKTTFSGGEHTPHHNVDSLPALATGANTIGNVGLVAGAATVGNVGLVAGTALAGAVRKYDEAGTIYIAGTAYSVKRQMFNTLDVSGLTIVSAVAAKKLRLLALQASYAFDTAFAGALASLQVAEETSGLPVIAPLYLPSTIEFCDWVLPFNPHGWGETYTVNKAIVCVLPSFTGTKVLTGQALYLEF